MKFGIISDIHEDIINLKKVLGLLEKQDCDTLVCLGDIVGFCEPFVRYITTRDASECLRLVRENCSYVVAGNHDINSIYRLPEFRGGFIYPDNWYDMDIEERKSISNQKVWLYNDELPASLSEDDKQYIASLPEYVMIKDMKHRIMLSHFVFPDVTGSGTCFPSKKQDLTEHFGYLQRNECLISLSGHIHVEGLLIAHEHRNKIFPFMDEPFDFFPYGNHVLKKRTQCIGVPPVISTNRRGGASILDTNNLTISAIYLT